MNETMISPSEYPVWFDGKKINEIEFCQAFLQEHPMICIHDTFFTVNGRVTDENRIRKHIHDWIKPFWTSGIAKKTQTLLEVLRVECYHEPLPVYTDRIHLANGTLYLDGRFSEEKDYCTNRLPVSYRPDSPAPGRWLQFLSELLYPEDIPTLQEYIGYCLIPSTKGQKMLFLTGKGGEGKSRIGLVMQSLLGTNMNTGSIAKVEMSPFARADLEHELVMVDDDMKLEALPQTNYIKSIVTAELPMDLEKKGRQSYQGQLYVRFMVFGNGTMKSLYDRSEGFFRRQLILSVKDRPENRADDPFIAEKMCAEAGGIFLWALEGLHRLTENNFQFTVSERTKTNMETAVKEGNNIIEFMESSGYFMFRADAEVTSKDLYGIYSLWCDDNAYKPVAAKSFGNYLTQHEREYHLEHTNTVRNAAGKRVWGFIGIKPLVRVYP